MAKHHLTIALVLMCLFIGLALSQTPTQPPKPGPEHKKLGYWVGTWSIESDTKASPLGPAGKATGTDRVESLGGFFLVFNSDSKSPSGNTKGVGIMGYDAELKSYTYAAASSDGSSTTARGSVSGNTWTWTWESKTAGKTTKGRFTEIAASPTSYTFKSELADEKGAYAVIEEGKATKK